jgi:EmrB/QacA subfamily drug resistance transporter
MTADERVDTREGDTRAGPGRRTHDQRGALVLLVVSAAILLDALDLSITQIALPDIQSEFGLSAGSLAWVANAYVLTYGGFLLLGGRLADLTGRRRILLVGFALFGAMSLVSGLAPSAPVLVVARALQGVGAALTVPASISIITTTFAEGPERNRALSIFGAAAAAGFSVGLVLGGLLTDLLDWRWIFLVKVPVVLVVALLALRVVSPDGERTRGRSYDLPGAVLSTGGLLLFVAVISQLGQPTVPIGVLLAGAVVSVGMLVGFVVNERRAGDPLLPLPLFRLRTLRFSDLTSLTVLAAPFGFSYVSTLYMQSLLGWSPLATALALLPGAALSVPVSQAVAPRLLQRFGLRATGAGALVVVAIGFGLLFFIGADRPYWAVTLPAVLICLGLGMGVAYPVFTIGGVTGVEDEQQGVAAGIQSTALQVGGGIGLAVVSAGIAAALGDGTTPTAGTLRVGVLVGTALPLIGALVAGFGLRSENAEQSAGDREPEPAAS